jgi:hypothetical protein
VGGLMMLWWDPGQRFRWPPRPRGVKAHFFFLKSRGRGCRAGHTLLDIDIEPRSLNSAPHGRW